MNRNNYPINEPIFPHWSNLGVEKTAEYESRMEHNDTSWEDRRNLQDLVTHDWARWRFMEFRNATNVDEAKQCEWCVKKFKKQGMTLEQIDATIVNFHKGEPVIREQVSVQDFKPLHIECAKEKIHSIKDSIESAIERMENLSRMLSN